MFEHVEYGESSDFIFVCANGPSVLYCRGLQNGVCYWFVIGTVFACSGELLLENFVVCLITLRRLQEYRWVGEADIPCRLIEEHLFLVHVILD